MASIKRGNYISAVKIEAALSGRKRRKSDLVVMWNSICHVTLQVLLKLHLSLLEIWAHARLLIWHDEIQEIKDFLRQHLARVPEDFSHSWRDGKLLCKLLNKLSPGCIPDAEHLDPNYGLRNMYYAFDVLENKFGITPAASVEHLVVCVDGSQVKLLEILSKLKKEIENKTNIPQITVDPAETCSEEETTELNTKTIAKGAGLIVAFVRRPANFNIYCSSTSDINLVIEIKGPCDTVCRERITKRSPRKKNSATQLDRKFSYSFARSISCSSSDHSIADNEVLGNEKQLIPLEYDIHLNQIQVTYLPLVEGQHTISILWQGQHVSDSPYIVPVESAAETHNSHASKQLRATNPWDPDQDPEFQQYRKNLVKFHEPVEKIERIGKVINRKVLRHIVKINGRDIAVDVENIDQLAAALLKMDYECQTDPSKTRRNSWGCTGDVERKVSVIRQFCVPPLEMEAQYMKLQKRSRSLTFDSSPLPVLKRSTSFENEDVFQHLRLETVSEDEVGTHINSRERNEETFADIDEELETRASTSEENQLKDHDENNSIMNSESTHNSSKTIEEMTCNTERELPDDTKKDISDIILKEVRNCNLIYEKDCFQLENAMEVKENRIEQNGEDGAFDISDKYKQNAENSFLNKTALNNKNLPTKNMNIEQNYICPDSKQTQIKDKKNNEKYSDNCCKYGLEESLSQTSGSLKNLKICLDSYSKRNIKHTKRCLRKNRIYQPARKSSTSKTYVLRNYETKKMCRCCKFFIGHILGPDFFYCKLNKHQQILNKEQMEMSQEADHLCFKKNVVSASLRNNPVEYGNIAKEIREENLILENEQTIFRNSTELPQCTGGNFSRNNNSNDSVMLNPKAELSNISSLDEKRKVSPPLSVTNKKIFPTYYKTNDKDYTGSPIINTNYKFPPSTIEFPKPILSSEKTNDDYKEIHIQENNLVQLEQFNFKQFNPISESNKGNLIKNKMKKLEKAINQSTLKSPKRENVILKERIDIKSKLMFWENANRKVSQVEDGHNTAANPMSINVPKELHQNFSTYDAIDSYDPKENINQDQEKLHTCTSSESLNKQEKNPNLTKDSESKLHSDFNITRKSKRSLSDPGILESGIPHNELECQTARAESSMMNRSSSIDNASSSGGIECLESSTEDLRSSTDVLASTEDEYIDDEIPDNSLFTYWGDPGLMKGLMSPNFSCSEDCDEFLSLEILKNQAQSYPDECKVFGIGTYYGYVAVKNRFRVLTKGAGHGSLSVSIEGFGKHDVGFVSVKYMHKDIYEVTYQVMRPGLYLIYVRWMEKPINGSPFLCKITF